MIVVSIVLVLTAAGLLVAGLARGSSALYLGSVATSVAAALALVVGARHLLSRRPGGRSGTASHTVDVLGQSRLGGRHRRPEPGD